MAAELGTSFLTVARIWRKWGIQPHRIETFASHGNKLMAECLYQECRAFDDMSRRASARRRNRMPIMYGQHCRTGIRNADHNGGYLRAQLLFQLDPPTPAGLSRLHDYS
jgi:hypothetical protein